MIINEKIKIKDIISSLEMIFSLKKAQEWDYVGYDFKFNLNKENPKILITFDLNKNSFAYALKNKIDLIITYHPFCFAPTLSKLYKNGFWKKELVNKIKEAKINIYSLHTNFDLNKFKNTSSALINKLNIKKEEIIKRDKFYFIFYKTCFLKNFILELKQKLLLNFVITNFDLNNIDKLKKWNFLFFPGSGDINCFLKEEKEINDLIYISSDLKWNQIQGINSLNKKIIIISHLSENCVLDLIKEEVLKITNNKKNLLVFKEEDFLKTY